MTSETLELICDRLLASPYLDDTLSIVWHAGEPMALPCQYYETAFEILDRKLSPVTQLKHCFQTNGTLITPKWLDFIKDHHISIGVSLDGPEWLNDLHRIDRAGKGSFHNIMRGIHRLQNANIPFHVISVLTNDALSCSDEIYDFLVAHHIWEVGFNIEEIELENEQSSLDLQDTPDRIRDFYGRLLSRNECAQRPLQIREIDGMTGAILGGIPTSATPQQSTPLKILSVDVHGNMSTYSPELLGAKSEIYNDFLIGNVHTHSIEQATQSPSFQRMSHEIDVGIKNCRTSCAYFELCGGGAPGNKFFEHGRFDATETLYCTHTIKALADAVLEKLEEDLQWVS